MVSVNPMRAVREALALITALVVLLALAPPVYAKMDIQEVVSPKGVKAWLVEDYSVPIITIRFGFDGGSSQDPEGKEGLASLLTTLFDEGAGDLDSDAFQEKLDDAGAEMSFEAGPDNIQGTMRMLADTRGEALNLLRLAVNQPRFDADPVDRMRAQLIASIEADAKDPNTIASIAWNKALYPGHPYSRRSDGTVDSLKAATIEDLRAMHKALFARDNLYVAVVGAVSADELKSVLDDLFAGLPEKAEIKPVSRVAPKLDQTVEVGYDQPQVSIRLAYPGVEREKPEFFAAYVMNHIFGGGTFTSRLFDEVREKRGLAYGVASYMITRDHSAALMISTATRTDRAQETLDVILAEAKRMAEGGVSEEELDNAKKYITGSYAISNLDSSSSIASALLGIQMENLGIDYLDRREGLIGGVTREQVQAEAEKLLTARPAIMFVGPEGKVLRQ